MIDKDQEAAIRADERERVRARLRARAERYRERIERGDERLPWPPELVAQLVESIADSIVRPVPAEPAISRGAPR